MDNIKLTADKHIKVGRLYIWKKKKKKPSANFVFGLFFFRERERERERGGGDKISEKMFSLWEWKVMWIKKTV